MSTFKKESWWTENSLSYIKIHNIILLIIIQSSIKRLEKKEKEIDSYSSSHHLSTCHPHLPTSSNYCILSDLDSIVPSTSTAASSTRSIIATTWVAFTHATWGATSELMKWNESLQFVYFDQGGTSQFQAVHIEEQSSAEITLVSIL